LVRANPCINWGIFLIPPQFHNRNVVKAKKTKNKKLYLTQFAMPFAQFPQKSPSSFKLDTFSRFNIVLVFLDYFDTLISKIILKN
jgi:hypothetical protein